MCVCELDVTLEVRAVFSTERAKLAAWLFCQRGAQFTSSNYSQSNSTDVSHLTAVVIGLVWC